jgi:2,5-dihydroxypyridine 5,6-dioxygenase
MRENGRGYLSSLFREYLHKSNVHAGESVLVFTDPEFAYPEYADAALAAAADVGAYAAILTVVPSLDSLSVPFVREAWEAADMVVGASSIPWIRHPTNMAALRAGARTLLVSEPVQSLRRMFPDDAVVARTYAGAKRLAAASEMRFIDDHGTELTMSKAGRKVSVQCGLADRPGRWDHWPSAMVDSTPLEDSANGVLIVEPGDVLFRRYVTSPMRITLRDGRIIEIEGGFEAVLLRKYLEAFNDPEAYRLSHVGWGTDHRADWNHITPGRPATWACPDQEGLLGTITVAIGQNAVNFPDEYSGLDGLNTTAAHLDISCRGKSLLLNGEFFIDRERIVGAGLASQV